MEFRGSPSCYIYSDSEISVHHLSENLKYFGYGRSVMIPKFQLVISLIVPNLRSKVTLTRRLHMLVEQPCLESTFSAFRYQCSSHYSSLHLSRTYRNTWFTRHMGLRLMLYAKHTPMVKRLLTYLTILT